MLRNFTKAIPLVPCLILMISLFAIFWPVAVLWFIDQSSGQVWGSASHSDVYTWSLWTPEMQTQVYEWALVSMCLVGFFVGIDAALRMKRDVVRISSRKLRLFFLIVHTIFALSAMAFDVYVVVRPQGKMFTMQQLDYLLCVQGLPVVWFLYSCVTFRESVKRRQRREQRTRMVS